jgi:negative regulator of flagellin synthesis FlgM
MPIIFIGRVAMSMTIDRIGSMGSIQPGKKAGQISQVRETVKTDFISLSSEAVEKSVLYHAMDLVSGAPDVRADRVAELKAKINDPSYINSTVIRATADKIMTALGI